MRWGSHLMLMVSSNDTGHFRSHRNSSNPEEDVKTLQLGVGNNHAETISQKYHLIFCVSFFNNKQLQR